MAVLHAKYFLDVNSGPYPMDAWAQIEQGPTIMKWYSVSAPRPPFNTVEVSSPFAFGVPFHFLAKVESYGDDIGSQPYPSHSNLQMLGFSLTDQYGNPLAINGSLTFLDAPEPSALMLIGTSLALMLFYRRWVTARSGVRSSSWYVNGR